MDATNPYQPPSSEISDTPEQKFASRLLSLRDKPLTLGTIYRMQGKRYVVLFIVFGLATTYFAWFRLQPGVYLMLGGLAGVLLSGSGVARVQTRLWPMQKKVLDWEKVQRMAAGESLDG